MLLPICDPKQQHQEDGVGPAIAGGWPWARLQGAGGYLQCDMAPCTAQCGLHSRAQTLLCVGESGARQRGLHIVELLTFTS